MPKIAALFLVFAGLAPGQVPEYAPAGTEAYTLDLELDGYVNGRMDPDRLMTVRGCLLERDAAYTYSLMLDAAEDDGIYLRFEDCYRSYWRQDAAYNRRCPITTVPIFSKGSSGGDRAHEGTGDRGTQEEFPARVHQSDRRDHRVPRACNGGAQTNRRPDVGACA